ncbi:MAG: hypothetical protein GY822_07290 [Deltaproteobacteria bacterium]|nr:hypothetical protein [Deltaproteobacteria bacterium]
MTSMEPDSNEMSQWVEAAMAHILPYHDKLNERAPRDLDQAAETAASLVEELPEAGTDLVDALETVFDVALRPGFNTSGACDLAYIPGGGLFHAALGEFIANAMNRYVGIWAASPGLVQLELNVVRWFCDLVGFGESATLSKDGKGSGGFLTTGGSLANFSAIFTVRRVLLGDDLSKGCIYTSDQAHHSVVKAAVLAGFPAERVRKIASDDFFHIDVNALKAIIAEDRSAGLLPFLVVGQGGTTNTGSVDDLDALAAICEAGPDGKKVAARRRSLRRLLFAHRARPKKTLRHRAGRLRHARPSQRTFSALRHRRFVGSRAETFGARPRHDR